MAANFDFDGTFNDETEEEEENAPEEEELEEGTERRSGPLRIILLLLVVLVLLCVVCFLAARTFGIQLPIPGFEGGPPTSVPTQPPPTDVGTLPTEEPTPGEPGTEPPATEEPQPGEPGATEEPAPGETEEPVPGTTEEPPATTEPGDVTPVPGPTSTPGPTEAVPPADCDNNTPPTAEVDGQPNPAMMGKGQAIVTFDGTGSSDPDGTIVKYEWEFGDASAPQDGETVVHGYTSEGSFVATLTVTDNCQATAQDTVDVTVVGPTPPASNDENSDSSGDSGVAKDDEQTAQVAPKAQPAAVTPVTSGWCYRVRRGDTLFGLSHAYGVPIIDLARANNITPHHFVRVRESLFIPSAEVKKGPNAYEVQDGDTLHSIAYQCNLNADYLAHINSLESNATLTPGQVIYVPLWR